MNTNNNPDWAWPALIQSLQRDIASLRDHADEARREAQAAREAHRREIDGLIEQLRDVKEALKPIISERQAAQEGRRRMLWDWAGRGGWVLLVALAIAAWHYVTNHLGVKHE